jgi:hypothetical protein
MQAGAEQHAFGPSGDGREQRQRIEAAIDEESVAAPDRVHHRRCFDGIGQYEQIADTAKPDQNATIGKRDSEIHVRAQSPP